MRRDVVVAGVVSLVLTLLGSSIIARETPSGQLDPRVETTAPTAAWSGAVRLAKGSFWDVAVVFDSANHTHVAVAGRSDGKRGIWYFTDRSGTWTHKRILADPSGKAYTEPSITVDSHDRIIIATSRIYGEGLESDGIFIVSDRGRARGTFPTVPTRVAAAPAAAPSLKAIGTRLALAYLSDRVGIGPYPALRFKTGSLGHWTTTTVAPHAGGPSLRIDSQGRARIAYESTGGVRYARAGTITGSFSVTRLPGTSVDDYPVALALDSGDQPTIAWVHSATPDTIRYAHEDGSWPSPTTVARAPALTEVVGISLDSSDVPHILAAGGSVREETRVGTTFVEKILATGVDAFGGALRISASGREIVLWAPYSAGLFMAQRSI
jgi:hypothetical protein